MRNFEPTNVHGTNPHGTASAPMQWLYQKEATGMESSKMYCPSRFRYRTYQCGETNYPVSWGQYRVQRGNMRNFEPTNSHGTASIGSNKEICETSNLPMSMVPIPMVPRLHQCNGYIKRKLPVWRVQKCIALVGADTVLTSEGPQSVPCHGVQYRIQRGIMRKFEPTNRHGTASSPMQWLYQKEATGMESSKMYCPSWCR